MIPTPVVHTPLTPGVYSYPPSTVVLTEDVVVPSITSFPPGTYVQNEVVTTVTDTKTLITCPYELVTPPAPVAPTTSVVAPTTPAVPTIPAVPTTTAAVPPVVPSTTAAPPPVESTTVPSVAPPAPSSPSAPSSSVPAPSSSVPSSSVPKPSGSLKGDQPGVPWGTTYTPYYPTSGLCMSKEDVEKDIAALAAKGIKIVRTYSTDCNTLENVGSACEKHGIQMMVGVFIDGSGCSASDAKIAEQISALKNWAKWDMVPLINIGNEAIINGHCSAQQIATLIQTCRGEFSGYTGPYTTAETVNIWEAPETQSALCGVVDVIGTNAHAFFNYQTTAASAGQFVKSQLDLVSNLCPGKEGIVLETGWPSKGNSMGSAIAGVSEQAIAIASIIKECGDQSILFSLYDDQWKDPNTQCQCENNCKFPPARKTWKVH